MVHSKHRYVLYSGKNTLWVRVGRGHLNVTLEPDPATRGSWVGLWGNFDGKVDNDLCRVKARHLILAK